MKSSHSSKSPASPASSDTSNLSSSLSTLTFASDITSKYTPDEYEKTTFYNGITGDDAYPLLIYRSNFTAPFPKPTGRFANIPVKSLRGVHNTPLNNIWDTVGPQIRDHIKARNINWSSIDPARFFTHGPPGEEEQGTLGPVVVWVGVAPGSTSSDIAHEVSQDILGVLQKHGVEDAVIEWREAVLQKLTGPPLMRHVNSDNPTHHVRRFLTPLLSVPLATQGMEKEDPQGTLTLWFHENKDKDGNPSDKVYGVTNCHVLRKDPTVEYEHKGGAAKDHVRVCGMRRFQRGLDDITKIIANRKVRAQIHTLHITALEAKEVKDEEDMTSIRTRKRDLEDETEAIAQLEALQAEVTKEPWSNIKLRDIGHIQYAAPITVDGSTKYTSDWAVFQATEAKVRPHFKGNVVDLGSKYLLDDLAATFWAVGGGSSTFGFPVERKLRIEGCATKEELDNPTEVDSEGRHCFIVGKDGGTTDLTIGRYAGLESYTNNAGIESIELAIYSSGCDKVEIFSKKGDSGSLVWHTKNGKARIVGQLHSGCNKGGPTSYHVTYCTPGWYLLGEIKKKFKYADFYRTSW